MDLEALRALVTVVELGSFVGAARRLGVARPTLRRRLEALEAEVGVPLLVRTRAGSHPTEAGALFAARGRDLLRDGTALIAAAREAGDGPSGELRLVMPVGIAPPIVAALMVAMRQRYPRLALRLTTAADPVAALEGGVDAAVSFGERRPGGRWVSMEIGSVPQRIVASGDYLARAGIPQTCEELTDHELLSWSAPGDDPTQWARIDGPRLRVEPALVSPDIHLLRQVAGAGLGLAFVPDGGVPEPGPPLVPVLDGVVGTTWSLRVVVPMAMEGLPRIRALLGEMRRLRTILLPSTTDKSRLN